MRLGKRPHLLQLGDYYYQREHYNYYHCSHTWREIHEEATFSTQWRTPEFTFRGLVLGRRDTHSDTGVVVTAMYDYMSTGSGKHAGRL